jgi:hypothetical protein
MIDHDLPDGPVMEPDNGDTMHFDGREPQALQPAPPMQWRCLLPGVNKVFRHHSNKHLLYMVVGYNNLASKNPNHPPMVEYVGTNGNKWSKPLSTWWDKMIPTDAKFLFDSLDVQPMHTFYENVGLTLLTYRDQLS